MKKLPYFVSFAAAWLFIAVASAQENPVDYVNPDSSERRIYGTTKPRSYLIRRDGGRLFLLM